MSVAYIRGMATRVLDTVLESLAITPIVVVALVSAWLLVDGTEPAPAQIPSAMTEPPSVPTADSPGQDQALEPAAPAVAVVVITSNEEQAAHVTALFAAESELRELVGESPRQLEVVVLQDASNAELVAHALQTAWGGELHDVAARLAAQGIQVSAPPYDAAIVR